jgi:uncharacterized protein YjbJ (UPF0337 family)
MNESPEREWDHLKGIFREEWNALTEEDFKKADGSMFKLYGIIRVKLGDAGKFIKKKTDPTDQN